MTRRHIDKKVFWKPKEQLGKPWTYKPETLAKIEEDKAREFIAPTIFPELITEKVEHVFKPKSNRPLQQSNGRRVLKSKGKVL